MDALPKKSAKLDIDPAGPPLQEAPAPGHTLVSLSHELHYFTTALLITHAFFDRDPLVEFLEQFPGQPEPFAIDYPGRQFFQGLGTASLGKPPFQQQVNWDHRLYAIHYSRWEQLREFVATLNLMDEKRQQFSEVVWHDMLIVDPISLKQYGHLNELPAITVTVFDVSSNKRFVYIAPAIDPPRTYPYVVVEPPRVEAKRLGGVALGPPPDIEAVALFKNGPDPA